MMWDKRLEKAILANDSNEVCKLMGQNVDPNQRRESDMYTPLSWAINQNKQGIALTIVSHQNFKFTSLTVWAVLQAVIHEQFTLLEKLLNKHDDLSIAVDAWVIEGKTPLRFAVEKKNEKAVTLLLDHGADPNLTSQKDKATPLFIAADSGNLSMVSSIVAHRHFKFTSESMQAVCVAIANNELDLLKIILSKHNDKSVSLESWGLMKKPALTIALEANFEKAVELLLNYYPAPFEAFRNNPDLLQYAVRAKNLKLLLGITSHENFKITTDSPLIDALEALCYSQLTSELYCNEQGAVIGSDGYLYSKKSYRDCIAQKPESPFNRLIMTGYVEYSALTNFCKDQSLETLYALSLDPISAELMENPVIVILTKGGEEYAVVCDKKSYERIPPVCDGRAVYTSQKRDFDELSELISCFERELQEEYSKQAKPPKLTWNSYLDSAPRLTPRGGVGPGSVTSLLSFTRNARGFSNEENRLPYNSGGRYSSNQR